MSFSGSAVITVLLFLVSAYGWGRVGGFFCDARIFRYHSLSIVLGLALLNAVGGVLNWLGWATAMVLLGLLLGGALLVAAHLIKTRPWSKWPQIRVRLRRASTSSRGFGFGSLVPFLLALLGGAAACCWFGSTTVFNIYDDFHTYLTRTVRMVQTGSLAGNAFDGLGLDSLGSQSFFHGFFIHGSEVDWLQSFDAVVCFAVCLLLVAELATRWRLPWFVGTLGVICVMVINPQHVNISPLYSGALLIMALIVCGAFLARDLEAGRPHQGFRPEVTLALFSAMIVTLKTTLAFFAFVYLFVLYAILFLKPTARWTVMRSAMVTGGLATLLIVPWACSYLPMLLEAKRLGQAFKTEAIIAAQYSSLATHNIPGLFYWMRLSYGDTPYSFLLLVVICMALGLIGLRFWWRSRGQLQKSGLPSVVAVGIAVPAVYLLNAHLFNARTAIRYSCPILIGSLAVLCLCFLRFGRGPEQPGRNRSALLCAGLLVIAIGTFAASFGDRFVRAAKYRSLLAFAIDGDYSEYSTYAVSAREAAYCRALQARIPAGAVALVWAVTPFHLDFTRNRLLTVSEPGLINPALHLPAGAERRSLQNYLRQWGVRYVLVETKGPAVKDWDDFKLLLRYKQALYRKMGDYGMYFRKSLLDLADSNRVIHRDDRVVLFELPETSAGKSMPSTPPQ